MESAYSDVFDIGRGVVQGDIISPVLFILALDQLVQAYDTHGTGVQCGEIFNLRVLGYADDAALTETAVEDMTKRLTALADAAKAEADMDVSTPKTFTQHVFRRDAVQVSAAEVSAAEEKFTFKCGSDTAIGSSKTREQRRFMRQTASITTARPRSITKLKI